MRVAERVRVREIDDDEPDVVLFLDEFGPLALDLARNKLSMGGICSFTNICGMFSSLDDLVVELVPHAASIPRREWTGEDAARPLSAEGRGQAERLASAVDLPVSAVCSSPARRCVQTVEPLARSRGLRVLVDDDLMTPDGTYQPAEWTEGVFAPIAEVLGRAGTAGRAVAALARMGAANPGGRVVACSHGDVIPALLAFLLQAYGQAPPEIIDRGGWYRLRFAPPTLVIDAHPAAPEQRSQH
jgi:broad specificity phosphatase PhoE